jgi:LCP family protein required for cell wall assembly
VAGAPTVAGPPRRWPRRLLIGLNIFLALGILLTATTYAYVRWRVNQIGTLHFGPLGGDDPLPEVEPGQPMNVLLVGSDTRENISDAEQAQFGRRSEVGGQRSDTIMVLHVDPQAKQAAILSVPRDLWVTVDGRGKQRINTAFEDTNQQRGAERLIRTIRTNLGININHYVQVDFVGFRGIVNSVGGVKIFLPAPARDSLSGLKLPTAGCIKLNGDQALSYVRSRHYQFYESGRWRSDPTSDFGRIQRQQDFIRRVIRTARGSGIPNPLKINNLISIATKNVQIDDDLGTKDMATLAKRFRSLSPEAVEMLTLPTVPINVGGAEVLRLKQPDAQQLIDKFNGVDAGSDGAAPAGILPAEVRVRVLNGSGHGGEAGAVALDLQTVGFGIGGTGDADSFKYIKPVIRYAPGQKDKALFLNAALIGGAQLREDRTLQGGDLVLITGSDYQGVKPPVGVSTTTSIKTPVSASPNGAPPLPQC